VRVSTEHSIDGTDVEERPWCREARKGAFVGDVHDAVLLKSRLKDLGQIGLLMDIAVPVRSPTNTVTGVLAAHLMADWLIDANASTQDVSPLETLILTSKGQVIVGPSALMGHALNEPTFAQVKNGAVGGRPWSDGVYVSTAVATKGVEDFPGFGWISVARISQEQASAAERRVMLWVLIGGIMLSVALALIGAVMARPFAAHRAEWVPESERAEPRRPKMPVRTGAE